MITITSIHPSKRPLFFADIKVGNLFISGNDLYVKIKGVKDENATFSWSDDEEEVFNAVCVSGSRIGELDTFGDGDEVALLKKDIRIEFDPDTDLQRWV